MEIRTGILNTATNERDLRNVHPTLNANLEFCVEDNEQNRTFVCSNNTPNMATNDLTSKNHLTKSLAPGSDAISKTGK